MMAESQNRGTIGLLSFFPNMEIRLKKRELLLWNGHDHQPSRQRVPEW
jgi:hypothetical protein